MTRYLFDAFVLDAATLELRDGDDVVVEVEPQTLQVLQYLIRHRHRVVPKTELLDGVWGDRFVSDSALTTRIKQARHAVGDDGRTQAVIRTSHRVGYRFVADVREEATAGQSADPPVAVVAAVRMLGRETALAALRERIDKNRLVTVTGVGGVGKSTLVARLIGSNASGSVPGWWCELASTRDPATLATVVLAAVGESQQPDADPLESVLRVLEQRDEVLVLDNCEHLAAAAAGFASAALARCPRLRIVATSRIPLQVSGESILPLEPLELDDAVECFRARAEDAGGSVDPTDPTLVELCRRLDGLPLALELAAARIRTLSTSQMVELLRHRFRLLSDPTDDDGRQESLHRTVEWSWEARDPSDQELLAALSVMVGRFTLDDAVAVGGPGRDLFEVADAVDRLVNASLVVQDTDSGTGARRFRLLETIRDFGAEKLADPAAAQIRHARHFADRAETIDNGPLQSEDLDGGLAEMQAMWANLRAAVGYAADTGDNDTVVRIIRATGSVADLWGAYEILDWCERADLDTAATPDETVGRVADALAIQGRMLAHAGDLVRALPMVTEAHRRHESFITTLSKLWCSYYSNDFSQVVADASRLRDLSRSERGMDVCFAECFEAMAAMVQGTPPPAEIDVTPDVAATGALATVDCFVAGVRLRGSDLARASELLEAVVTASLANGYRLLYGAASSVLIQATLPNQPTQDALPTMRRALVRYRERGIIRTLHADLVVAARLLADAGDTDTAARLLGTYTAGIIHDGLPELTRMAVTEDLKAAVPDRFDTLTAEGASWSPPEAADVAIAALDHHIAREAEPPLEE